MTEKPGIREWHRHDSFEIAATGHLSLSSFVLYTLAPQPPNVNNINPQTSPSLSARRLPSESESSACTLLRRIGPTGA